MVLLLNIKKNKSHVIVRELFLMSSGYAHNFGNFMAAPAMCNTDIWGQCIPNPTQYDPPGPPCSRISCGCGKLTCSAARYNEEGLCKGYMCGSLGGPPFKLDYLDYYGQIVEPSLVCRPDMRVDPVTNQCVHDFRKGPFRTWSWQQSLKDFRHF